MEFENLEVSVEGAVGRLTLDRPRVRNALSIEMQQELIVAAERLSASDVKVVVLDGAGASFCVGVDLAFLAAADEPDADTHAAAEIGRLMAEAVTSMRPITIAKIHGHCVGGGVVLAASCDLRVATADTYFSIPEVDAGIPLAWGGIPRLVREIGPAATRDLVLTCRPFTAAEALSLGLLNRIATPEEIDATVDELVDALVAKSAYTLEATKRAVAEVEETLAPARDRRIDADLLREAIGDPDSRDVRLAYLDRLGHGR